MKTFSTAVAASLAFVLAFGSAEAKQCKAKPLKANGNVVNPQALFMTAKDARSEARKAWDRRCVQLFSGVWCDRAMATGHRYSCNRVPNGVGGYKHVCELTATPCRN